jgi:CheY-like chemotaxis protein
VPAGESIVPAAVEHRPDLTVTGIDLPGMDRLTAAAQLYQRHARRGGTCGSDWLYA